MKSTSILITEWRKRPIKSKIADALEQIARNCRQEHVPIEAVRSQLRRLLKESKPTQ